MTRPSVIQTHENSKNLLLKPLNNPFDLPQYYQLKNSCQNLSKNGGKQFQQPGFEEHLLASHRKQHVHLLCILVPPLSLTPAP